VTQQDEKDAVIATGIAPTDRVVTTGFANLSDGAKVTVSQNDQAPAADLAPRKRQGKRGERQGGGNGERRGKRGEGSQKQSGSGAQENGQSSGTPKTQP
jgi:multidrug efflux system membrane fusion protein